LNTTIKNLLENNPQIWRGSESKHHTKLGTSTGFAALDKILPLNGWPTHGLIEVVLPRWGIGELQLLLPALIEISQTKKRVSWIAPPFIPYAPALVHAGVDIGQLVVLPKDVIKNESLWAMEKILRNKSCGIAMAWPNKVNDKAMRRLQLAAEEGNSLGVVFRNYHVASSPAALRLSLCLFKKHLKVTVLKAKGSTHYQSTLLNLPVVEQPN